MTAAGAFQNQKPVSASNQEPRSREPSMEDILASIRRIIADDQLQGGRNGSGSLRRGSQPSIPGPAVAEQAFAAPAPEEAGHDVHDDILDLAKMPEAAMPEAFAHAPQEPVGSSQRVSPLHDIWVEESEPVAIDQPAEASVTDGIAPIAQDSAPEAFAEPAAASTLGSGEAHWHDTSRSEPIDADAAGSDALISPIMGASMMSAFETLAATVVLQNTDMLDRVMHDLMRPMLKSWLEENLPALVERLVRVEIERVARGARR